MSSLTVLGAYPAAKELLKDVQARLPLIKRKTEKFFQRITNGLNGFFGRFFGSSKPRLNPG